MSLLLLQQYESLAGVAVVWERGLENRAACVCVCVCENHRAICLSPTCVTELAACAHCPCFSARHYLVYNTDTSLFQATEHRSN